jgi:GTP-binding protein
MLKGKQLTNVGAVGTDENIVLTPPVNVSLVYAPEFIDENELMEVTPKLIRIRKKYLKEHESKRASRQAS